MFGRNTRLPRTKKHNHDYADHNVGADLRRQVCRTCGQISIEAVPPVDVRAEVLTEETALFGPSHLTVSLTTDLEPVGRRPRFGERRNRL